MVATRPIFLRAAAPSELAASPASWLIAADGSTSGAPPDRFSFTQAAAFAVGISFLLWSMIVLAAWSALA